MTDPDERRKPWEGADTDAMLKRAALGIVAFGGQERPVDEFEDAAAMQEWIDEVLTMSSVRVSVAELDVPAYEASRDEPEPLQRRSLNRDPARENPDEDELQAWYYPWMLSPTLSPDEWYRTDDAHREIRPSIGMYLEGSEVLELQGYLCVDVDTVADHLVPRSDQEEGRWFVISIDGTGSGLAFPRDATLLQLAFDNDGATVEFIARHGVRRRQELALKEDFEERWSTWLDDTTIAEADIREGVQHFKDQLAALLTEERP